ncbi:DNA methyltransferase [Streptomyces sp. NPDC088360]|uniref:DNA methyltransferase n=1 Tax=Streptomyces sp. NPDC088360 TaxID=3154515 RepID=UPI00344B2C61
MSGQDALPMPLAGLDGRRTISPKRPSVDTAGLADIFPYYAGFSFDFASAHISAHLDHLGRAVVLDPWNGSGTTTLAAQHLGHAAIGVDLNPAANIIAQLRCRIGARARSIPTPKLHPSREIEIPDPLSRWLGEATVRRVRDWTVHLASSQPEESSLGYVAIFRALRKMTRKFEGSNPTWVKSAKSPEELVELLPDEIDAAVRAEEKFILGRLHEFPASISRAILITSSSGNLPLVDNSVDVIVTSPPYLTRIDYGVAYSRELAVLGIDTSLDRRLRSGLMGTTLIRKSSDLSPRVLSNLANSLVKEISSHSSKASGGYYLKQAVQYFNDLTIGLDEVTRVAKPGASMTLVVQDSYYKDIHVRLADICVEEAVKRGWKVAGGESFTVKRSLTSLNKSAREYAKGEVAESVLDFQL